jgi:hypothetical protein
MNCWKFILQENCMLIYAKDDEEEDISARTCNEEKKTKLFSNHAMKT